MPIIARIDGIVIRMFFRDHAPPHFHATKADRTGLFAIQNPEMFKGNLANKEQKAVTAWAADKKEVLLKMWETQQIKKID